MADHYEALPQNLQLRVNTHIVNALGQDADFLNQFRRMSQFAANGNGRDGAQKTLDMLRDSLAPQADGLAALKATNVTAAHGQVRDLQRQLLGVIGSEIDRTNQTGVASWNSPEYIAGVVNNGLKRIAENEDALTVGSDLTLKATQLTAVTGKMANLASASDVAAQCTSQVTGNAACASVPKVAEQRTR